MGLNLNKALTWMTVIFIAICMVWSCANGFWTFKNWQEKNDLELKVQGAGISCNNAMATLVNSFGNSIKDYPQIKIDIENLKKNQVNNIDKDNTINVNPNNK
jgi:hypothetical protein